MIYSKLCLAKESNEKEPKKIKRKFRHVVRVCGLEMLVLDKQESDPEKILHSCIQKNNSLKKVLIRQCIFLPLRLESNGTI